METMEASRRQERPFLVEDQRPLVACNRMEMALVSSQAQEAVAAAGRLGPFRRILAWDSKARSCSGKISECGLRLGKLR